MSAESEVGFLPRASVERFSSMGMGQIGAMASILDDYKDYFREDKEKRVFGLKEVAETTIRLQAPIIARLGVETSVSCPEGLAYFGLRNECSQILTNLVVNALDAIAERKPELPRIDIVISQESGAIAIEVRDSGGGMAEATLARLFEPYFTTKAKGTGIGLYICKAMLERDFGGSLSARNEGPGSAFTARLGLGGER
jgi:C4-dicarboxylate-specific signal transduction histidine kinase